MDIPYLNRRGFTLIELLMVIVLVGIISITVGALIYQGTRSFGDIDILRELEGEGTLALERLSRELRLIRCTQVGNRCTPASSDITQMTSSDIRFYNIFNEGRGFRLDGTTLKLRQGVSDTDTENILCGNVSSLSFEYLKSDRTTATSVGDIWTIVVNLTLLKGTTTLNFKTEVHPRSFR